jgi:hypothetical protein
MLFACDVSFLQWDLPIYARVETLQVEKILDISAHCGGNIIDDGGSPLLEIGLCFGTTSNPTIETNKVTYSNVKGNFYVDIVVLKPLTTYYLRAYAITKVGITYGNEVVFKTFNLPTLTTNAVSSITPTSAICGGYISNNGGLTVTQRGICYSLTTNPTIANSQVILGSGTWGFSVNITGLASNATYYLKAFATNAAGTSYGNEVVFKTTSLPTLTTLAPNLITQTTVQSGGEITASGSFNVIERGNCYSTTTNPTIANSKVISGSGPGIFTTNITALIPGTKYYIRAYATNSAGTAYGNEVIFKTFSLPTLTTITPSLITQTTVQSGSIITDIGSSNVTERGICYSTNANPTIANTKIASGSGTGSFTINITGLTAGTKYYIKAYATNSYGTAYGNENNFTTLPVLIPTLSTTIASSVTTNSAITGGSITSAGGGTVTERGICYGTTSNPTILNTKITSGSGIGNFSVTITGIASGTKYYVKAYAKNSAGTAYGNEINFTTTTATLPNLTTTSVSSVTTNSVISGGNVTSDGGASVTARGVCYSTSTNPTISSLKVSSGTGSGSFSATMSGLSSGTTYYIKAYATNSVGTAYGNEINFMTNPVLTIGQSYQGGIIFYIDGTGLHGLISASTDQSTGAAWGCSGTSISSSGTSIGTGSANTTAIVSGCSTSGIAARLCYDLVSGGYSDWYLPSYSELNLMYTNLKSKGFGSFINNYYWSSSQYSSVSSYLQSFTNGSIATTSKSSFYNVRAIRSF